MSPTLAIQYPPVMLLVKLLKTQNVHVTPQNYMVALKITLWRWFLQKHPAGR